MDSLNSPNLSISGKLHRFIKTFDKRSHVVDPFSFQRGNKFKFYILIRRFLPIQINLYFTAPNLMGRYYAEVQTRIFKTQKNPIAQILPGDATVTLKTCNDYLGIENYWLEKSSNLLRDRLLFGSTAEPIKSDTC